MMSIMSGFSFTPIIFFICSFFILSNLDFRAVRYSITEYKFNPYPANVENMVSF
jgi:hypothetical protein